MKDNAHVCNLLPKTPNLGDLMVIIITISYAALLISVLLCITNYILIVSSYSKWQFTFLIYKQDIQTQMCSRIWKLIKTLNK